MIIEKNEDEWVKVLELNKKYSKSKIFIGKGLEKLCKAQNTKYKEIFLQFCINFKVNSLN